MAAHHAEGIVAAAVAQAERRDDGVHRALREAERVGMRWVDHEAVAAVVQHDAGLLGRDADAEGAEQRVNHAHGGAVAVDDGDVHRVAAGRRRGRQRHPLLAVDAVGEHARERLVEEGRHRRAHEGRVGDVGIAHRIGEPRGLELDVQPLSTVRSAPKDGSAREC